MAFRSELAVREHRIPAPGLPEGGVGLRIAQVTDFHFRGWSPLLDETRRWLLRQDYDVLVVTGDICFLPNKWRQAASMCRRFFEGIEPRFGTFAVMGNHDSRRLADQPGLPFHWLHDEHIRIETDDGAIQLAGVDQSDGSRGDVSKALAGTCDKTPTVLLAHYPSTVFDLESVHVTVQLSGHTHGGQIVLPRVGCLFTNDRIPTQMAQGCHHVSDVWLCVSAGIGTSGPKPMRFRYRCPAELSFVTLEGVDAPQPAVSRERVEVRKPQSRKELAQTV